MIRTVVGLLVACLLTILPADFALAQEETVCIQCHAGQSGYLATPVEHWRGSIHARNGISCQDCHGGDPTDFAMAMSPERGFIGVPEYTEVPDFCGRCHVGVQEDYAASAHGQAIDAGGAQCVVCHGAHAVEKAEIDLINPQDCSRCHEYGRAGEIKSAIQETEQIITNVEQEIEQLHLRGITTEQMENSLFDLRNRYRRLFHSVEVDKVRAETRGFQNELTEIKEEIDEIHAELGQRKMWGGVAVGLLLFCGIVSLLIRLSYHEEEKS